MNQYAKLKEKLEAQLEARRCWMCMGLGTLDDAAPGDMYVNQTQCHGCKGSGLKRKKKNESLQQN